jgi:hypothetical protein
MISSRMLNPMPPVTPVIIKMVVFLIKSAKNPPLLGACSACDIETDRFWKRSH